MSKVLQDDVNFFIIVANLKNQSGAANNINISRDFDIDPVVRVPFNPILVFLINTKNLSRKLG